MVPAAFRRLGRLVGLPANRLWIDDERYVDVLSEAGLRYHERQRTLFIHSELGVGMSMAIWPKSIRWWEALDDREEISNADRARILGDIVRAAERVGYQVDVRT